MFGSRAVLVTLALLAPACASSSRPPEVPPPTVASPPTGSASGAAKAPSTAGGYRGLGESSVTPEVMAKFAPKGIAPDLSRRIQAMLDIRVPGAGMLSKDGKRLFFSWTVTGVRHVFRLDGPQRFPVQLTGGDDTTSLQGITPDDKWLVVSRDRKGEENPGLYLLSPDGGALAEIQHKPKVQTEFAFVTDDAKYVYYTSNDRKADAYAVYRYAIATKTAELVFSEDGLWSVADHKEGKDGRKLLLVKSKGELAQEVFEYDESKKSLTPLFGQNEDEEYSAVYAKTDGEVLVKGYKRAGGTASEFRKVLRFTKEKGFFAEISLKDATMDVEQLAIDASHKRIYLQYNEGGYARVHVHDAATFAELPAPPVPKEAEYTAFGALSRDARFAMIVVGTSRTPARPFVYDWQTKKGTEWVIPSAPEVDLAKFVAPKLETYPARDGTKIPMFVRRPPACEAKDIPPCPVVVVFHGGPEGQSRPSFNTSAQLYVDAGFVYVEPNVRGSDGYGRSWLHADDGPKRLAVITDIEDAARHVRTAFAKNGKAPKVGIMGGSYGGYSTLVGMSRFAGAFDAGVAIVGMSNLLTFLENTAPYRRKLRISEYGDPVKDKDALVELSPVTHVGKVKSPLLLIQGASDPRVPVGEAVQFYEALEARGQNPGMVIFPDEGHGAKKRDNIVRQIGYSLGFFEARLLGKEGR